MTDAMHEKEDEEEITLDNWKPKKKEIDIIFSEWRQQQIGHDFNQHPGTDEIKKIKMHLKKNVPNHKIMEAFGITAETLVAIKTGNYDPIYGISLDSLSKIQQTFEFLEKKINRLDRACEYIAKNVFVSEENKEKYKKYYLQEKITKAKKIKLRKGRLD